MTRTLGRHHPTIRRLRALRRDADRRREEGVLLAEGLHLAREALDQGAEIDLALVSSRLERSAEGRELERRLADRGEQPFVVDEGLLDTLQDARSPQPILLLVRRPVWDTDAGIEAGHTPLVAAVVGVQDPGNLGSLIRTADAAGASACFVTPGSADPFHPRAVRATMGSVFRLPVHAVDPELLLARLRERGLRLVGAGPRGSASYDDSDLTGPLALFFGAEGTGLPQQVRDGLDETIAVPMARGVESLSVGAAAAVVLFEAARQSRRNPPQGL